MSIFAFFSSKSLVLNFIFLSMIACSIINWGVVITKFVDLSNTQNNSQLNKFIDELNDHKNQGIKDEKLELKIDAFLSLKQLHLERGINILANFASLVPFVGLLGTVIGIANALKEISLIGSANIVVIAAPIGEALFSTAFGLFVAIPAGFFYNFFSKKIENIIVVEQSIIIDKIL